MKILINVGPICIVYDVYVYMRHCAIADQVQLCQAINGYIGLAPRR